MIVKLGWACSLDPSVQIARYCENSLLANCARRQPATPRWWASRSNCRSALVKPLASSPAAALGASPSQPSSLTLHPPTAVLTAASQEEACRRFIERSTTIAAARLGRAPLVSPAMHENHSLHF